MATMGINNKVAKLIQQHESKRPNVNDLSSIELERCFMESTNTLFRCKDSKPALLFKFCRAEDARLPLICEREEFVSIMGTVLGIPVVNAWVFPTNQLPAVEIDKSQFIIDKCVVMELLPAKTVHDSQDEASKIVLNNVMAIANTFAFLHWIGDEDRGTKDVLVHDSSLVLIDNGLCGPAPDRAIRGAHPAKQVYVNHPDAMIKMCFHGKPSLVAFVFRHLKVTALAFRQPKVLVSIKELTDESISQIVAAAHLPQWIADTLILRREILDHSYLEWLSSAAHVCGY